MIEIKNVPELRFPEFSDSLQRVKLGLLTTKISDGIHSTPVYDEQGEYFFVNGNNLIHGRIAIDEKTKRVNEAEFQKHKRELNNNTILLSINGTIGNMAFFRGEKIVLGKSACYINIDPKKSKKKFVSNYIQTVHVERFFNGQLTGSTIKNLSLSTVKSLPVFIPEIDEQQKIADFLSSVDKKIEQLTEKHRLLTEYKKGVMQQIFTQQIRFKDDQGNDYPEWQYKPFSSLFKFGKTNSLSRVDLVSEGNVQNIHYGDIHTKLPSQCNLAKEDLPFIAKHVDLKKYADDDYCQNGDLIIADASEDYADIGKAIELSGIEKNKVLAGLHTFQARPNESLIASGYSGYVMQIEAVRKQIMRFATGVSVLGISKTNLGKVLLPIPKVEEQQKIANFLTEIDQKINQAWSTLEQTKAFKKGLLQKMFV